MSIYEKSRCDRCGHEENGHMPLGWMRVETSAATDGGYERAERRDLCPKCATELRAFWLREERKT